MSQVVTIALAETLEQSEIDTVYSRLAAIKERSGNPMDVEIQRFGNATAFTVKNIPGPSFNTIKGLKAGDEEHIEGIIEYYQQREIPVRFELTPARTSSDLLAALAEAGCYQSGFHTTLFASADVNSQSHISNVSIQKLRKDNFDLFAHIYTKGFQMPDFLKSGIAQNNEILYDKKGWSFYLASVENEPAGIGVLFIQDGIATLAAAATIPHIRNKGVHGALIQERIKHALSNDCKLIVGQARFGSVSQTNMERAGLKIAYTKSIWTKLK